MVCSAWECQEKPAIFSLHKARYFHWWTNIGKSRPKTWSHFCVEYVGKNQPTTRYDSITCAKQGLSTKTSTTVVAVLPTCEGAWGCWTIQLRRREIFFARKVEDLKAHNVSFGYSKCHPKATHSIVSPHQKIGEHFSNFQGRHRCDSLSPMWMETNPLLAGNFPTGEFLRLSFWMFFSGNAGSWWAWHPLLDGVSRWLCFQS